MICQNCGRENKSEASFCAYCGVRLTGSGQSPDAPFQEQKRQGEQKITSAYAEQSSEAGKGAATASFILGIIAVLFWFFGKSSFISIICGIIGLMLASSAKSQGYEGGMRTAGFVLSLIGLIGGALIFVACAACVSGIASLSHY